MRKQVYFWKERNYLQTTKHQDQTPSKTKEMISWNIYIYIFAMKKDQNDKTRGQPSLFFDGLWKLNLTKNHQDNNLMTFKSSKLMRY